MDKQNFIKYLESKELAQSTQKEYLLKVNLFLQWVKKEDIQITKSDVLKYLKYLKTKKTMQNVSRQIHLFAINHYFTFLYEAEKIAQNPCLFLKIRGINTKKLYKIYTPEELDQLYDNYYQIFVSNYDDSKHRHKAQKQYSVLYRWRNALIVSILFNQGTSTSDIEKIEVGFVDLIKATLKIRGGKRGKERVMPLKATQIGLFMNYLQNIRPQLIEYQTKESEKLFLPLPAISYKKTENDMKRNIFTPIITQIKMIDKQFINFQQIRASVISFWIKTQGLRKAQHLAGHRCICTTEKYVANNLDSLIEDINKLHPF